MLSSCADALVQPPYPPVQSAIDAKDDKRRGQRQDEEDTGNRGKGTKGLHVGRAGETIWGVRGKTGAEVAIPIGPTLHAALKQATQHDAPALLASSRGEQWIYNGFSTVWHRFKTGLEAEELIQPGLTLKGLRHTVATTLREAGLDERRIADLLGQKTLSMARHYSRSANLAAKNRETMAPLETENARRAQIVKSSAKSVKPKPKEKSE